MLSHFVYILMIQSVVKMFDYTIGVAKSEILLGWFNLFLNAKRIIAI